MERYHFKEEIQIAYESLKHPLAIFQITNTKIVAIVLSDGFCELFGYKNREEAYKDVNQDICGHMHPNDIPKITDVIRRFVIEKNRFDIIYRNKTIGEEDYRVIRVVGKHVQMENDIHLAHVWYTDESEDVNQKIIELQESVSSLLKNMPAMTFSKDVNTRKYIACNQAFADYAHKDNPGGVVGLTDYEIFDRETADHFVEDDKKALVMDKPYIFYEDVPDAAGNPRQFQTTKLKFIDATGRECLLGLCQDVTDAMRIKREYDERLASVQNQAHIDALTGVRNKFAYSEFEAKMDLLIAQRRQPEFSVTIFDVNDLKKVNDTMGHKAGDEFICKACNIICREFSHSPVFRIGGDEFVAISEGEDYERIDELIHYFSSYNKEALKNGEIVIACGMAKYNDEKDVASVFIRADKKMYDNKNLLKK